MALSLSAAAILEKNKICNDEPWLILLEIQISSLPEAIRVVYNNEDIKWDGYTWVAFPFDIDEVNEDSKGDLSNFTVKVSNVSRTMQSYIEQANGGVGASVILRVVHAAHLDLKEAEIEEIFTVQSSKCDNQWIAFALGGYNPTQIRMPNGRYIKDWCPYKYKDIQCGYNGNMPPCNQTLNSCRERGNSIRFGGEPAIPGGGIYASNG